MGHIGESWVSGTLRVMLGRLTSQQAEGIRRIVVGELGGVGIIELLRGPDRICAPSTYYGKSKNHPGWYHRPDFQAALEQARADYRASMLKDSTSDAVVILKRAVVEAARDIERQVTGNPQAIAALSEAMDRAMEAGDTELAGIVARALGETGKPEALPALEKALAHDWGDKAGVYQVIVTGLGFIGRAVDVDRQKADTVIFDRADIKTASKATVVENGSRQLSFDVSGLPAEVLRAIANARIEAGSPEGRTGVPESTGTG